MIYVVRGQLALTNLTAYIANAHMMSVTWDLPPNLNAIDKVFITIEDVESNRTIQMQSFDNSIKKLDIQIKANDAYSVQPNRTIRFSARCSDRNGQNSTTTVYQMYINMKDPAPLNVRVFRVNDTSINVTWDPISYPEVSRYTVYYNDKSETKDIEKWPLYALSPHTSSALISDLKPDVIYNIRVNAEFIVRKDSIQTGFYPEPQFITQYDDLLSRPTDMTYTEVTANSIRIWFSFEDKNPHYSRKVQRLEVHYEGVQNYIDSLGIPRFNSHRNSAGLITLPADGDINREWLVTGLAANTNYTLNLSGTTADDSYPSAHYNVKVYSRPATIRFQTDYDSPPYVDRPDIIKRETIISKTVPLSLHKASTKNGPIDRYYIVVHLFEKVTYQSYVPQEGRKECCYTAAVFSSDKLPDVFTLGDGRTTIDYYPFAPNIYNNSPIETNCKVKLVSWGFSRKQENLTTSSATTQILLSSKPIRANQDSMNNLLWIFGVVISIFIIFIILVVFTVKYSRTKKKPITPPPESVPFDLTPKMLTMEMPILPPAISPASSGEPVELRRTHCITASNTYSVTTHPPIHVDEFAAHVERLKAADNYKFSQEYESIDPGQQFSWDNSLLEYNRPKNRYANVIAYDHSRVVLRPIDGIPGSDYINANYMDGYRKQNTYIATQGPLPDTFGDFWRMVFETNSACIVMMTKLEERNRLKCDQYWPSRGTETYGPIQVTLTDLIELASYSIRTFNIAWIGHPEKREIRHCQFTAWPDHGLPDHATSFLMFLRRVKTLNPLDSGPIIVHCSAGVGRTGCFIVLDAMVDRLKHEKTVDIYGHVTLLRSQRNYIVQTEEQYIFIHDADNEAIQSGYTEILAKNLFTHLQRLLQPINDSSLTEMELEFKRLANVKAQPSKFISANLPSNKFKNRLVNILPYENTRVCLSPVRGIDGSDYINASYIDGYHSPKAYIATQGPLLETVDDFWRMLWEHNSTIIVMLTKLKEMGREKCVQYWPNEHSSRYGYFVVDPIAEYNMPQYVLREFKVTDSRDRLFRTVRQFLYTEWPDQGVPKFGEGFIDFIGQVHKTKEQFGQDGPIIVHCSAGVGRTGVFITLSIVLDRIRYEGVVDVFQTVKLLRTQRPAMVQTEDQYQFCYRAALEYLGSFDNFSS
ncbi:unnamed protein product [Didymodactylos carnosus]|uniref:Protein-tyrosine-phosphatase n=2 Tax=Didymodactylos carnosus TaxID=1234261 RepID=A0A813YHA5_9BILA|nr:unnamed protein product [Didymodactylos carnosus]CAF3669778.1 unnamed protein product [Didymodactylos carnosus]